MIIYTLSDDLMDFTFVLIFILEEILKTMMTRGLQGTTALSRQAGQEILSVLKFTKS